MAHLTMDGLAIEYRLLPAALGSEDLPPLVFLHDGLGSITTWRDFPDAVRDATGGPATLVYSRRGYGASEAVPGPWPSSYMHDEALSVLPAVLRQLGLARPILVGHSDGASIALIFAGAPNPTAGLVVMAPHVVVEPQTLAGIENAAESYREGRLAAQIGRHHRDPDAVFHRWSEVWSSPGSECWSITSYLQGIEAPVLACQGDADEFGTTAQLDLIARHAPGHVETTTLPGVGHVPHAEAREQTLALVSDFVERCQTSHTPAEGRGNRAGS